MKQIIRLLFLTILFINSGCNTEKECGECFTPPTPFLFEIIDKETRENLFTNGTYESSQIEIKNIVDNSNFEYTFLSENNYNLIQINSIGWYTETVNISVKIGTNDIFNFYVDAERLSEDCCSFTKYHEIRIDNSEFELDSTTGIYRIITE